MDMAKTYVITLSREIADKLDKILKEENLTPREWIENAVKDYDS